MAVYLMTYDMLVCDENSSRVQSIDFNNVDDLVKERTRLIDNKLATNIKTYKQVSIQTHIEVTDK